MKKVNVLEYAKEHNVPLLDIRGSGNTTRLIDCAIQIIFNRDICVCENFVRPTRQNKLSEDSKILCKKIIKRIKSEHFDSSFEEKISVTDEKINNEYVYSISFKEDFAKIYFENRDKMIAFEKENYK